MNTTIIKHIENLFKNTFPKPDAAGNFYEYPLQSLFTITHGGINCGQVDIIRSNKFILTQNDFKIDNTFPSMSMRNSIGNQFKFGFTVNIKEPKDFKKLTGTPPEFTKDVYLDLISNFQLF